VYEHEERRRVRAARRGATRTRVIWRRQVIDSPSGDTLNRQRASLYPVTGTGQTAYISKAIGLEGPLDDEFSVTRTDPRKLTRLIDIRRFTSTNARATPTQRWTATKNLVAIIERETGHSFLCHDAGDRLS